MQIGQIAHRRSTMGTDPRILQRPQTLDQLLHLGGCELVSDHDSIATGFKS